MDGHEVVGSPEAVARRPAPLTPALAAHLHSRQKISQGSQSFNDGTKLVLSLKRIIIIFFSGSRKESSGTPCPGHGPRGLNRAMDGHSYIFHMMKIFDVYCTFY